MPECTTQRGADLNQEEKESCDDCTRKQGEDQIFDCFHFRFFLLQYSPMAVCAVCTRTYNTGHLVSHAKNRVSHKRMANLHRSHVLVGGIKKRVMLCTTCIRMMRRAKTASEAR